MEVKGPKLEIVEFEDLWRIPGKCDANNVVACKQATTTSENSTTPRGYLQSTIVWVDNAAQGWLVLFGGLFRGNLVRTYLFIIIFDCKNKSSLVFRKENNYS